jgi:hypothetical protein
VAPRCGTASRLQVYPRLAVHEAKVGPVPRPLHIAPCFISESAFRKLSKLLVPGGLVQQKER